MTERSLLERFVEAQAPVYATALAEIRPDAKAQPLFAAALERWFAGECDLVTLSLLSTSATA